ncbi:MAG: C40 family peptidase [Fervidobacterium sp.]
MYGIVKYPVTDMRSQEKFRSERIHQVVFGEVVEVFKFEKDYVYACDIRLNYCGYINKHTLFMLTDKQYADFSIYTPVKIRTPFCKTYGAINYLLPFGSRVYSDNNSQFYLPNGQTYYLMDDPSKGKDSKNNVVSLAMDFLGIPYLWGGTSSYGFDCSGFVNRLYDAFDTVIPRDASQQEASLPQVEEPDPGDLLFMEGHVMLYIGDEKIIHANGHDMCVSITDLKNEEYGIYLKSKIRSVCRAIKL